MNSYKGLICNFKMGIDNSFEVTNGLNACIYGNNSINTILQSVFLFWEHQATLIQEQYNVLNVLFAECERNLCPI